MIPKIIHYCWFGPKEISPQHKQYIEGWKKLMPDFEFRQWNEESLPLHFTYCRSALEQKKWVNLSNFTRLFALHEQGGIYLDTDIELIKPLHALLGNRCFLGVESIEPEGGLIINNAIIGAEPGHPFLKESLSALLTLFDGSEKENMSGPWLMTIELAKKGKNLDLLEKEEGIKIFPPDYFYPFHWRESLRPEHITSNTISIHHWEKSWKVNKVSLRKYLRESWASLAPKLPKRIAFFLHYGMMGYQLTDAPRIQSGPFKGMALANSWRTSQVLPSKIMGNFEGILHPLLYEIFLRKHKRILIINSTDGYYPVGLAKFRCAIEQVLVFEDNLENIKLIEDSIRLNKASNIRLSVGKLTENDLCLALDNHCTFLFFDNLKAKQIFFKESSKHWFNGVDFILRTNAEVDFGFYRNLKELFLETHVLRKITAPEISFAQKQVEQGSLFARQYLRRIDEKEFYTKEWIIAFSKTNSK